MIPATTFTAWMRTYTFPGCYSIFLTSLALEWSVKEARTIALLGVIIQLYFDANLRHRLLTSTQLHIALCFPLIALASWYFTDYGGEGLKTFDWIICLGIGCAASTSLDRKAVFILLLLPAVCATASICMLLWEYFDAGTLNALFMNGAKLKMYDDSPNRYGLITALGAAVSMGLLPMVKQRAKFILLALLAILTVLCWYSQSRAAVFSLVGTVCVAMFFFFKHSRKQGILILIVVGAVLAAGAALGGERIVSTITRGSWDFLLNGREDIWQAAWEVFQKSPLFGFGVDSFRQTLEAHLNLPENAMRFPDIRAQYVFWNAHQIILGIMVETGLAGLLVFLVLSARTIYGGIKKYPLALAPLLMFILYWINGLGGYGFHRSWNSAFFFLAMGLIDGLTLPAQKRLPEENSSPGQNKTTLLEI